MPTATGWTCWPGAAAFGVDGIGVTDNWAELVRRLNLPPLPLRPATAEEAAEARA